MMEKEIILKDFYDAFTKGDFKKMNSLYDESIVFNDPIFKDLNNKQVTTMWKSLLSNKKESKFEVSYELLNENDYLFVTWTATYLFGPKRRKVTNIVDSRMEVKDGKIIKHTDSFNFKKWAKQSIGGPAFIFGNQKWFKNKVSKAAIEKIS
ncbi:MULTISPECIES: nuclear transport factor 2 family protein [Mesoplasma]|uniref:Nuclear transport factor 2 family protein n=1 Tax=Mesoplasma florum TaxID=2151 RepID=A0A2R3P6W1_MESFO|nr:MULTISPECIES: nuclear transport factor 2 family protein [Mesoplasma]AVN64236.1 nuclear transport factor 2 family protein [Mesoplasma florum]